MSLCHISRAQQQQQRKNTQMKMPSACQSRLLSALLKSLITVYSGVESNRRRPQAAPNDKDGIVIMSHTFTFTHSANAIDNTLCALWIKGHSCDFLCSLFLLDFSSWRANIVYIRSYTVDGDSKYLLFRCLGDHMMTRNKNIAPTYSYF